MKTGQQRQAGVPTLEALATTPPGPATLGTPSKLLGQAPGQLRDEQAGVSTAGRRLQTALCGRWGLITEAKLPAGDSSPVQILWGQKKSCRSTQRCRG